MARLGGIAEPEKNILDIEHIGISKEKNEYGNRTYRSSMFGTK